MNALNSFWKHVFGFPSIGYWSDNGLEFKNEQMIEMCTKMGISINFGPAYSPWSNGMNERNHASADITIKKMLEEETKPKVQLTNDLVKSASWVHNTNVNRLGYSPLQIATGKSVTIPGLTTGTLASESVTEAEAVRNVMDRMRKMVEEFRTIEMKHKLEDSLKLNTYKYQHQKPYKTGDQVWYQSKDSSAWSGPAVVICHEGINVWIRAGGDIRKVAQHRVQPFKLLSDSNDLPSNESNGSAVLVEKRED